jgi:hypothetical protein
MTDRKSRRDVQLLRDAYPECAVHRGWHLDGAGPARYGWAATHPGGRVRFLGRSARAAVEATATRAPLPSVRAVAVAFLRQVEAALTAAELRECRRRNAREPHRLVCHTHDHHDANMFMEAAFESLGISTDDLGGDDERTALWNAAWDYARDRWLGGGR